MSEQRFEWVAEVSGRYGLEPKREQRLTLWGDGFSLDEGPLTRFEDVESILVYKSEQETNSKQFRSTTLCVKLLSRDGNSELHGSLTSVAHTKAFVAALKSLLERMNQKRPSWAFSRSTAKPDRLIRLLGPLIILGLALWVIVRAQAQVGESDEPWVWFAWFTAFIAIWKFIDAISPTKRWPIASVIKTLEQLDGSKSRPIGALPALLVAEERG